MNSTLVKLENWLQVLNFDKFCASNNIKCDEDFLRENSLEILGCSPHYVFVDDLNSSPYVKWVENDPHKVYNYYFSFDKFKEMVKGKQSPTIYTTSIYWFKLEGWDEVREFYRLLPNSSAVADTILSKSSFIPASANHFVKVEKKPSGEIFILEVEDEKPVVYCIYDLSDVNRLLLCDTPDLKAEEKPEWTTEYTYCHGTTDVQINKADDKVEVYIDCEPYSIEEFNSYYDKVVAAHEKLEELNLI